MKRNFKILLATDYSEAVMNAERYAVQLARDTQSTLTFLHVYKFPLAAAPTEPLRFAETKKLLEQFELTKLEKHRDNVLRALNIGLEDLFTECVVKDGSAGTTISKTGYDSSMDFIIVGTHGTTSFRKIFYGTHAWEVITKSSVPVLAIPQEAMYAGVKNIVFATEYREGEIPVINYLAEVARLLKGEVTVLHVTNYLLSKQMEADLFGRFKKEILEKVPYDKLRMKLIKDEIVSEGLEKFCAESKVDWLVMSPEKPFLMQKFFFPITSMTRKMSFYTRVPLLSIPDFYNLAYAAFWKIFSEGDFVNEDF